MKTQLKYLKLFEDESYKNINSHINIKNDNHKLNIINGYNDISNIQGNIIIENNIKLKTITGFNNVESIVGKVGISIENNPNLIEISGFEKLRYFNGGIHMGNNPKFIYLSIPHQILKRIKFNGSNFYSNIFINRNDPNWGHYSRIDSVKNFLYDSFIIDNLDQNIKLYSYPDNVIKQIIINLEFWGDDKIKKILYNHMLSIFNYIDLIPKKSIHLIEPYYIHLYNSKHANTGARNIAKMTTGRYLGTF